MKWRLGSRRLSNWYDNEIIISPVEVPKVHGTPIILLERLVGLLPIAF